MRDPEEQTSGTAWRVIRTLIVFALVGAAAWAFAAPAAQASPLRVWLQLTDPLATDPVRLQVAAMDSDGYASAFTGTVTLAVGKTRSSVKVSSQEGQEEVEIPTTTLTQGSATVSAVLKVGGTTLKASIPGFIDIPSSIVLQGFGCGVISPTQKRIAWQVASIDGQPYQWPSWTPDGSTFPSYIHTTKPTLISDSSGNPIKTKGTVVVLKGTRIVGRVALKNANRRLLFSVPWPGALTPGTYTASVTLTDSLRRTTTATQSLLVAKRSAGLCSR